MLCNDKPQWFQVILKTPEFIRILVKVMDGIQ